MLRWPCLITGILVTLLFLVLLVSCRVTGLPFSEEVAVSAPASAAGFLADSP